ncbi:MAG: Crp/Fnr family transcriptional regulator [Bacteroidota bacterium]
MIHKLKAKIDQKGYSFSEDLWREIQQHGKERKINRNEVLIDFGSHYEHVYFIAQGSFMTSMISESGDKRAVWFHLDELFEMATCLDSFFLKEPTKYEIKALEDSIVLQFHKAKVDLWVQQYPAFNRLYLSDIVRDFIAVNELRAFRLANPPREFLTYLDTHYPLIKERISSKNMAHFLGVTPEWYSKMKKKMES